MCTCATYADIEFLRSAMRERIKASRALKKSFGLVANHSSGEHKLYACPDCGQLWQGSRAWNWGNDEYLFRVPAVDIGEWLREVFVQPDEMMVYVAAARSLLDEGRFVAGTRACTVHACDRVAVEGLATCLQHHLRALQNAGQLAKDPTGRWFGPYVREDVVPAL